MSDTLYTWSVAALDISNEDPNFPKKVTTVHWRLDGTFADTNGGVYGANAVGEPAPANFVDFDNLTEAEVIAWVEAALGDEEVAELKANIDAQIADKIAPKSETLSPPW